MSLLISKFMDKCPYCDGSVYHVVSSGLKRYTDLTYEGSTEQVAVQVLNENGENAQLSVIYKCDKCGKEFNVTWHKPIVRYDKDETPVKTIPEKLWVVTVQVTIMIDNDRGEPPVPNRREQRTIGYFSTEEKAKEVISMLSPEYAKSANVSTVNTKLYPKFNIEELDKYASNAKTWYLGGDIRYALYNDKNKCVVNASYPGNRYGLSAVMNYAMFHIKKWANDSVRVAEKNSGIPVKVVPVRVLSENKQSGECVIEVIHNEYLE